MAEDNVVLKRDDTVLGPQLGVVIGDRVLNVARIAIHIESSIYKPYATATVHFSDPEGLTGYMDSFVRGMEAGIIYTGNVSYESLYSWLMVIDDIQIPESASARTPLGDVVITLIPKWVYEQRATPDKIYTEVLNPTTVIEQELKAAGLPEDLIQIKSPINDYSVVRSFYKSSYNTYSSLGFLKDNVLPWSRSNDDSPLFLYQSLSGGIVNLQSSLSMAQQPVVARLYPAAVEYAYGDRDSSTPLFPFHSRSYFSNLSQDNIFGTIARYIDPRTKKLNYSIREKRIDFEGLAPEVKKEHSPDRSIYFPGWRCLEEREACSQAARAHLLQKQTHILACEDYQVATICDVGTKVELFDLGLAIPEEQEIEEGKSHIEKLHRTPMSGEYIVSASHYYYDAVNEDGFNGAVIEVSKLGFDESNFKGLDKAGSFIEV